MKRLGLMALSGLLLTMVACHGTLEVGIERTATPDVRPQATIEALRSQNAQLATEVARQNIPVPPAPDLGRLAYIQGGDVWIESLPAGKPLRLTTDGRNREPRWSPSGQWLSYRKDKQVVLQQQVPCDILSGRPQTCYDRVTTIQEQVWLTATDGNGSHPLNEGGSVGSFAWSPREDRIAYVTSSGELDLVNADNTGTRTLVGAFAGARTFGRAGAFVWSPDGIAIAYEWKVQTPESSASYQGLWIVLVDSQAPSELYSSNTPLQGEALLAGWSGESDSVLFWQSEGPTASAIDGLPFFTLPLVKRGSPQARTQRGSSIMLTYPDFVAAAPTGTSWGNRGATAQVIGGGPSTWTGKRIEIGSTPLSLSGVAAISPAWSPDGSLLAYAAMPDQPALDSNDSALRALMGRHLWVTNTQGEPAPRQVTGSSYRDERPEWSADGKFILFARLDSQGRASLWTVPAAGGTPARVVEELTPSADPLGFFGHIEWENLFDWWRGVAS